MIHLAGLTSLAQQSKSHYLQFAANSIWINVQPKMILPKWFKIFPELVNSDELIPNWEIIKTSKLNAQADTDLTTIEVDGIKLKANKS